MYQGIANSTRRTYATAQRRFIEFCFATGQLSPTGFPCPADEWTLMSFTTELSKTLHANTVKVYLAGVRSLHIEQGFQDPFENRPRLARVIRGVKRLRSTPTTKRMPVTMEVLRQMKRVLQLRYYDDALFWAASCFGFFGFLRCGEFTVSSPGDQFDPDIHLCLSDVSVDSHTCPSVILARIKASKTDPYRKGFTLRLCATGGEICPVQAVTQYLHMRGGQPGSLFRDVNGKPLTRASYSKLLQAVTTRAGVVGNYSSHSLRIGAATTAAQVGVPDHMIKTLGRWQSDAYQIYIRTPEQVLDNTLRLLVKKH